MSETKNAPIPHGIAICNPGNLRTGVQWQGAVGEDHGFLVFANDLSGIRAAAINLWTARYVHHRHTISEIISAYAPPAENPTDSYIEYMAHAMGVEQHLAGKYVVHVDDPAITIRFLQAQFVFEQGFPPPGWRSWPDWYCTKTMDAALAAAGHWPELEVTK